MACTFQHYHLFCVCCVSQDQYVFLHDALMEGLMCGNTRIEAANLEQALAKLLDPDPTTGQSQLEEQFNTLDKVTPRPDPALCSAAQMNPERNRNMDYLPSKSGAHVVIQCINQTHNLPPTTSSYVVWVMLKHHLVHA